MREGYCYCDRNCRFEILPTPELNQQFVRQYIGIFPRAIPKNYLKGTNLRQFELIVQAVFADVNYAESNDSITSNHVANLKEIFCAIVHWKMASQGGRAVKNVDNVRNKWKNETLMQVINGYRERNLSLLEVGGVRIPTATAFLRFLFPDEYGIMDSRVVKITQRKNITELNLRKNNGYILDVEKNRGQYYRNYNLFLVNEARHLNSLGILFQDEDEKGNQIKYKFRPCDIEMALWASDQILNN